MYTDFSDKYTNDDYNLDIEVPFDEDEEDLGFEKEYDKKYKAKYKAEAKKYFKKNLLENIRKQLFNIIEHNKNHEKDDEIEYKVLVYSRFEESVLMEALSAYEKLSKKLFSNISSYRFLRAYWLQHRIKGEGYTVAPRWYKTKTNIIDKYIGEMK